MTTASATITCPSWCRTDHEAERAEEARRDAETTRYMRAPENQAEMRYAFGQDFVPPAELAERTNVPLLEEPLHRQEIGRVYVQAAGEDRGPVPVVVVVEQLGDEAGVGVLPPERPYADDSYTAEQARALAALLVVGAQVLEA